MFDNIHSTYSEDKISEIGHRLVSSLINNKQFLDASNILIDHIKDIEEGINVLCQGHYWMNALRVACKYNLLDLIGMETLFCFKYLSIIPLTILFFVLLYLVITFQSSIL